MCNSEHILWYQYKYVYTSYIDLFLVCVQEFSGVCKRNDISCDGIYIGGTHCYLSTTVNDQPNAKRFYYHECCLRMYQYVLLCAIMYYYVLVSNKMYVYKLLCRAMCRCSVSLKDSTSIGIKILLFR